MAVALNLDTLNAVWADLHNPLSWKQYKGERRNSVKDMYARYRQALAQARPFSIDDRALKIAYKLSVESAETVARRLMLARLPFPKTWIEFDFKHKLILSEANGTSPGIAPGTPSRIGYLLEESPNDSAIWAVTTFVQPDEEDVADVLPKGATTDMSVICWMVDTLNRAPPKFVGKTFKELQRDLWDGMWQDDHNLERDYPAIRHLGWGYTDKGYQALHPEIDVMRTVAAPEVLNNSINCGLSPLFNGIYDLPDMSHERLAKIALDSAVEQRGDVRLLVALLSLINEVPIIKEFKRPSGHVGKGGTIRPYLQNTIVRVNIPTKRYMSVVRGIMKAAQKRAKARHEVRGHWRTIVHKHTHERVRKMPDGSIQREWIQAGELERVWVEHHERGDASVGYVKHKYLVDKGKMNDVRI